MRINLILQPPIIEFYREFVKELNEIGLNLKSIITNMQSSAQVMTLDLSKALIEDKLPNGVSEQFSLLIKVMCDVTVVTIDS